MKLLVAAVSLGVALGQDRQAMIEEIQRTPGVLWRVSAKPASTSRALVGVKPEVMEARRQFAASYAQNLTSVELPDHFDSETNWPHCAKVIGDIRDQSNCGCCWAFAAAEAASDRLCIATKGQTMVPLSAQDLCFCASDDGCNGGDITSPWNYIKESGIVTGGQFEGTGPFGKGLCSNFAFPHCHHHGPQGDDPYPAEGDPGCPSQSSPQCPRKCDKEATSPHDDFDNDKIHFDGEVLQVSGEEHIMQTIMEGGPVETAFTVFKDFENYDGGIYHHVSGDQAGGHAVKMVGWGEEGGVKYWKIANSWNPYWAEKGYFRIKRGNNEGGIEDMVTASSPTAKWYVKPTSVVV